MTTSTTHTETSHQQYLEEIVAKVIELARQAKGDQRVTNDEEQAFRVHAVHIWEGARFTENQQYNEEQTKNHLLLYFEALKEHNLGFEDLKEQLTLLGSNSDMVGFALSPSTNVGAPVSNATINNKPKLIGAGIGSF
jgi:hypothetical protein